MNEDLSLVTDVVVVIVLVVRQSLENRTSTLGHVGSSQRFIFYPNLVNRNNNSVWQKRYSNNSPTKCRSTTKEFRSYMLCFSLSVCFVTMRLGVEEDDQETLERMLDTIAEKV